MCVVVLWCGDDESSEGEGERELRLSEPDQIGRVLVDLGAKLALLQSSTAQQKPHLYSLIPPALIVVPGCLPSLVRAGSRSAGCRAHPGPPARPRARSSAQVHQRCPRLALLGLDSASSVGPTQRRLRMPRLSSSRTLKMTRMHWASGRQSPTSVSEPRTFRRPSWADIPALELEFKMLCRSRTRSWQRAGVTPGARSTVRSEDGRSSPRSLPPVVRPCPSGPFPARTHYHADVAPSMIGQEVVLAGWLTKIRLVGVALLLSRGVGCRLALQPS